MTNELNDKQLEDVAGGKIEWAEDGFLSADDPNPVVFTFPIGARVEKNCLFGTERGTVVERKEFVGYYRRNSGFRIKCPIYKIKFDKESYQESNGDKWWYQNMLSY